MIITRTPFRIPLGGGSTDLPEYYKRHGGFIFAVTINLYIYISVNYPPIDNLIRLKYSRSEEVKNIKDIQHTFVSRALQRTKLIKGVEITSMADVPEGTGLGSSGSYLIGLLNALRVSKGENVSRRQLAEEAFEIASNDLKLPDGVQDFFTSAFGNFTVLEIDKNGKVKVIDPKISLKTKEEFEKRTLLFYTGVKRSSKDILQEQRSAVKKKEKNAVELKHKTKEIGQKILKAFEEGNLDKFGKLLDKHWSLKKRMSNKMSNLVFDEAYDRAKKAGALGGKILGAGGGGFFLIYCKDGKQNNVRKAFQKHGMKEIKYKIDGGGTQVLLNRNRNSNTI
jgi:D-glycero-alpha-D-manno-heptose-7-phosphate kinase